MKRKMLAAQEDLANQLKKIADRRGTTLYALTNQLIRHTVKMDELDLTFEKAVREGEVLQAAKNTGFILCPENLLYEVMDGVYEDEEGWLAEKWYESGEWCGKYYHVKHPDDPLKQFMEDMHNFFWNVTELKTLTNSDQKEMGLQCLIPRFPKSYAVLFTSFLEGALNSMGYQCDDTTVTKGIIKIKFRPSREE
ncbi:MAG: hypothetical protein ACOC6G_04255 [Thermoproteota archaeon]